MHTRSYLAASALLLAALGCREDAESPAEPRADPQADVAAVTALSFRQVSAGRGNTCSITTDNQAYCWGDNLFGQLGDGTTDNRQIPTALIGDLAFKQVSAGTAHTCGVTTDYRAYCWGTNGYGALGNGTTNWAPETTPMPVRGGLQFRQVSAGDHHTCGLATDNQLYCWGHNSVGQLGDGTTTDRLTPRAVAGGLTFRQVSVGSGFYAFTCGLTTNDQAYCWGSNQDGQLGDSSTVGQRMRPSRVASGRRFRQLDAGDFHVCAVSLDDKAFCWGNGRLGQLGNGKTYLSFWPRRVAGGLAFSRVSAGGEHTCGETTTNRAYCWGANPYGQLGDGSTTKRLTPVAVVGGHYFKQVTAGSGHTCGKTPSAVAYCWGDNWWGEAGDGTSENIRPRPTRVADAM